MLPQSILSSLLGKKARQYLIAELLGIKAILLSEEALSNPCLAFEDFCFFSNVHHSIL